MSADRHHGGLTSLYVLSAEIIQFPLVRRHEFIQRHATRIAEASPATARKLLARTVQVQIDTMRRRGVRPAAIAREAKALESAIRREQWRLVTLGGGAA
jgi:predicted nucleic acid-binding Zn ribbon protein